MRGGTVTAGRRLLGAVFLCLVGTLLPLAHASPPDPSWIAGYWDDGDHDDVVAFLADGLGSAGSGGVDDAVPLAGASHRVGPGVDVPVVSRPACTVAARAPPARSLPRS